MQQNVRHRSSLSGVSSSFRKIVGLKIIIHNILYFLKLTTLYINTPHSPQVKGYCYIGTHPAPPVEWLPMDPRSRDFDLFRPALPKHKCKNTSFNSIRMHRIKFCSFASPFFIFDNNVFAGRLVFMHRWRTAITRQLSHPSELRQIKLQHQSKIKTIHAPLYRMHSARLSAKTPERLKCGLTWGEM